MSESDKQLSKALVRIYYQGKQDDGFAGCAIRLSSQFVVTCAHVLQTAIGSGSKLEAGLVFAAFLPHHPKETRQPKLKLLAFFSAMEGEVGSEDIDDVALLEIQGGEPDEPLSVSCPPKYAEDGDVFTVKSSVGSDVAGAKCGGVFGAGWLHLKLVNNAQVVEPGDSGSPVWNDTKQAITAMLVARKKQKELCYAIPMYKVIQAFPEYLVQQTVVSDALVLEDLGYLEEMKQDILSVLKQSDAFREQVLVWCKLGTTTSDGEILSDFVSRCERGDFVALVMSLRSAFDRAMPRLEKNDHLGRKNLLNAARDLVSKLVVFTIKQSAIIHYKNAKHKDVKFLPKMAGSVAAGVAARTLSTRIKFLGHQQGCFDGDNYLALESGFSVQEKQGANNTVDLLLKKLGEKLVPHAKRDFSIGTEKTDLINRINAKIQRAKTDKDPKYSRKYFFILPLDCEEPSATHQNVIQQLTEKIRDVTFFYITSKYAHDVLTTDDYAIDEVLIEFFTTLSEYPEP